VLVAFQDHTGELTSCVQLQPGQASTGNVIQPVLCLTPLPGANGIAVGLADGRVAIVDLAKVTHDEGE
jgi:hypothetical protein